MKRGLVTGGSGTIGAAICQTLASRGLHVIVHAYSHQERASHIVDQIIAEGNSAEQVDFDIRDTDATRQAIEKVLAPGPIQVLVHNAGVHDDAPMAGMTTEQWTRVIDISLHGFFNVTQPLLLPMLRTRWGRIISLSSVAGVIGNRGQTNYAAAKSGLHGATRALALEMASRGVTVNVVAPGLIDSPATGQAFTQEQIEALVPMKRAGTAQEVAELVAFLASDKAGYISGQVIGINGAMAP